ncbi:kinase-like domain-containing protein [Obelidium mucronatum]|nr:kinase-like domain-containing protein [Obelidium mucronatum]
MEPMIWLSLFQCYVAILHAAQALAIIHDLGYCYGDIRQETLLLGEAPTACGFRPPEALPGYNGPVDGACADVYQLGVVLCELLTEDGRRPRSVQMVSEGAVLFGDLEQGDYSSGMVGDLEYLDADVRHLIQGMCGFAPSTRLSMRAVESHPWFDSVLGLM